MDETPPSTLEPDPPRPQLRCTKWRYPDKKAASTAINERMRGGGGYGAKRTRRRGRPEFLRSYFCDECHAWHLTHKPLTDDECFNRRRPFRR